MKPTVGIIEWEFRILILIYFIIFSRYILLREPFFPFIDFILLSC